MLAPRPPQRRMPSSTQRDPLHHLWYTSTPTKPSLHAFVYPMWRGSSHWFGRMPQPLPTTAQDHPSRHGWATPRFAEDKQHATCHLGTHPNHRPSRRPTLLQPSRTRLSPARRPRITGEPPEPCQTTPSLSAQFPTPKTQHSRHYTLTSRNAITARNDPSTPTRERTPCAGKSGSPPTSQLPHPTHPGCTSTGTRASTSRPASHTQPPPLKRKAQSDQPPQHMDSAPTTHELRTEYQALFASLQKQTTEQITTLQKSMHDLHAEILEWMRTITQQPLTTTPPTLAPLDAPIPIDADHDQEF